MKSFVSQEKLDWDDIFRSGLSNKNNAPTREFAINYIANAENFLKK